MNQQLVAYALLCMAAGSTIVPVLVIRLLRRVGAGGGSPLVVACLAALTALPFAAWLPWSATPFQYRMSVPNLAMPTTDEPTAPTPAVAAAIDVVATAPAKASPTGAGESSTVDARWIVPGRQWTMPSMINPLIAVWLLGVGFGLICWLKGWRQTCRWLSNAKPAESPALQAAANWAQCELGLRRAPRLFTSPAVESPVLVRAWKPVVIVPVDLETGLDAESLNEIVLHEFVHARRRDLWIGLWQRAVATAYWFQPLLRRLNREIDAARERACDARVGQSASPIHYARTLLLLAERITAWGRPQGALALHGSCLESRIASLLDGSKQPPAKCRFRERLSIFAIVMIGLLPLAARPATETPPRDDRRGVVDASKADQLEGAAKATFPCRRDESEIWITPNGDVHQALMLKNEPGRVAQLERQDPPAGSQRSHVLKGVEVWAKSKTTVDVVASTGNPRSFLPAAVVEKIGAPIVGEIDLEKADPLALALAGLTNVKRSTQTKFKIARIAGFNLGLGPKGGSVDALVLEQEKPLIGIVGVDWMAKIRRGDFGLIHAATGQVYFGRMVDEGDRGARILLACDAPKRRWDLDFADCELRAAGVYWSQRGNTNGDVIVEVGKTAKPLVLSLSAYYTTTWHVRVRPEANLRAIVVSGYFEQKVEGVPASTTLLMRSYFPSEPHGRSRDYFYAYDRNSGEFKKLAGELKKLTGLELSSFEGAESKDHFEFGQ